MGGWIADTLVERGWSVTTVRKVMQTVRTAAQCNAEAGGWMQPAYRSSPTGGSLCMPLLPPPFPAPQIGFLGPAFFLTRLGGITSVAGAVGCMMAAQVRGAGANYRWQWTALCRLAVVGRPPLAQAATRQALHDQICPVPTPMTGAGPGCLLPVRPILQPRRHRPSVGAGGGWWPVV